MVALALLAHSCVHTNAKPGARTQMSISRIYLIASSVHPFLRTLDLISANLNHIKIIFQ